MDRNLSAPELRRVWACVDEVAGAASPVGLRDRLLPAAARLVDTDQVTYNELRFDGTVAEVRTWPEQRPEQVNAAWRALMHQHPTVRRARTDRALPAHRLSDLCSDAALRRLPVYHEVLVPAGAPRQLNAGLRVDTETVVGICIARAGRDFTDRDARLLTLAAPHLVTAYWAAQVRLQLRAEEQLLDRLDESSGPAGALVDRVGRVLAATAGARAVLARLSTAPTAADDPAVLPGELMRWLRRARHTAGAGEPAPPYLLDCRGRRMTVRLAAGPAGGDAGGDVLLFAGPAQHGGREPDPGATLTVRERAVADLAASGLTNVAIGRRLAISPRTVDKHLQRVYVKLGVPNRAAAVSALAGHRPG